jgi:hypothetical protein
MPQDAWLRLNEPLLEQVYEAQHWIRLVFPATPKQRTTIQLNHLAWTA